MLLAESTITAVRNTPITEIVSRYVKLKRAGANMIGCCPFHNEKTASFTVTDAKGIFKCFGCGESGDAIAFVMKHDKMDFLQAVETIANIAGIAIEYTEPADAEKYAAQKEQRKSMSETLQLVIDKYKANLWQLPDDDAVMKYLAGRGITRDSIIEWQLGWATTDWRHLSPTLINAGQHDNAAAMGIIKRGKNDDSNYDGYRSRIIIPIANHQGQFIGMGGRYFQVDPADAGKDYAKYINPTENELYSKSATLFGLNRAIRCIQERRFAWLTEGYFDVISMHNYGDENTVATCGTALTAEQAKLLKKYTSHVVLLRDQDKAGQQAACRDIPILIRAGFKVEVAELPAGQDPDSFIQSLVKVEA